MTILVTLASPRLRARVWHVGVAVAIGVGFVLARSQRGTNRIYKARETDQRQFAAASCGGFAAGREAPDTCSCCWTALTGRGGNQAIQLCLRWQAHGSTATIFHFGLCPGSRPRYPIGLRLDPEVRPDSDGVGNAKPMGGDVPYDRIDILSVSGLTASRVTSADRADFMGWEVEWDRARPIKLAGVDAAQLCPWVWSSDPDALLDGWSGGERDKKVGSAGRLAGRHGSRLLITVMGGCT